MKAKTKVKLVLNNKDLDGLKKMIMALPSNAKSEKVDQHFKNTTYGGPDNDAVIKNFVKDLMLKCFDICVY